MLDASKDGGCHSEFIQPDASFAASNPQDVCHGAVVRTDVPSLWMTATLEVHRVVAERGQHVLQMPTPTMGTAQNDPSQCLSRFT